MVSVDDKKHWKLYGMELSSLKRNFYEPSRPFYPSSRISKELEKLGFTTSRVGGFIEARLRDKSCVILDTLTSFTSIISSKILKDKEMTRAFLERAGVKIAEGAAFNKNEKERAREFVKNLGCVVIKPADGNKGRGVSANIRLDGFEQAWQSAMEQTNRKILVEKYFSNGTDARYLVVDGECVAVCMMIPPQVQGDGKRTISELVDLENESRKKNPCLMKRPVKIDRMRLMGLKRSGYDLSSVLGRGEVVIIDKKTNLATGGNCADITDEVHPSMKRVAEEAALAVPYLDIVGIDMIAINHAEEASEDNYVIIEANTRPGIGGHHYPTYGTPRNVARDIALSVFKKMNGREIKR